MTIEQNKADFEKALDLMKGHMDSLYAVLDSDIFDSLSIVVSEYEGHLKGDIESLININENLSEMRSDRD
jgi:hypothetical protein